MAADGGRWTAGAEAEDASKRLVMPAPAAGRKEGEIDEKFSIPTKENQRTNGC